MPNLSAYQGAVYNLLQAPTSPTPLVPLSTVTSYINIARQQLAADAECVRGIGQLLALSGIRGFSFTDITISENGYGTPIAVRQFRLTANSKPLDFRSWDWFQQYILPKSSIGIPKTVAQLRQGTSGTILLDPVPANDTPLLVDTVWLPIPLVNDSTVEAIPYPWTDAVQFYAAWLAFMQLQRQADADTMLSRYKELAWRGRQESTSTQLPDNFQGGQGSQAAASKSTLTHNQAAAARR